MVPSTSKVANPNPLSAGAATGLPPSSLIICSRNRSELLWDAIQSIFNGLEVPDEIIVIDQSDLPDGNLAALSTERRSKIRYKWTTPLGLSHARNLGVKTAQNDWLVFTDDDVLVSPGWFGALLRALIKENARTVVTGRVLALQEASYQGFAPSTREDDRPVVYEGRVELDPLDSVNMAFRKFTIAEIGGFDERLGPGTRFPSAEDNDFGFRLLDAGYRIVYVPQALLYHRAWRTDRDFLALRRNYGIGRGAFYAKHMHWRDRFTLKRMLQDVRNHLIRFVSEFKRDRLRAYGDVLLAGGIIYGAVSWLLTQRGGRS